MKVRPGRAINQAKKDNTRQAPSAPVSSKTFPSPIAGWVLNENLASQSPGSAIVLDNWFPTSRSARLRGGRQKYATIGGPVVSMFTYQGGSAEKLFAATDTAIYDISAITLPEVVPTPVVTGQTNGYYSSVMFSTAGGDYLYAVNGLNKPKLFDGSAWSTIDATSTPIAITGVDSSELSHIWSYGSRLFFVQEGTQTAWYLPVDSLGGAAQPFSLAGVFRLGGSLLFGATWSGDSGSGLNDRCVFVSTLGEVAVYQGTNPGSAADWSKVGLYQITAPMGKKCVMQAGGDLLVGCKTGIVPLSEAVRKDPAALSMSAVSRAIEPEWKAQVQARTQHPWEIMKWPTANMMVVSQPGADGYDEPNCFVANMETGAWCRFTNMDTRSLAHFGSFGYYGTGAGTIHRMETGGSDDGIPYTGVCAQAFDHLESPGKTKTVPQARAVFKSNHAIKPKLSVSVDYNLIIPAAPSSGPEFSTSEWDSADFDVDYWDGETTYTNRPYWNSIGRTGFVVAPQIQVTSGVTPFPRVEIVSVDLTFFTGEIVT